MFQSNNKKLIATLNAKLEYQEMSVTAIKASSEKGVSELHFAESEGGGKSIGFLLSDDEGYISFNQFFDKLLFPLIYKEYSDDNYPQLVLIVPNTIIDTVTDELSDKHLFPIEDSLDDLLSIIIVRKKDLISYYDKNKKEFEELNKSREKRIKIVEKKPFTLPITFSNIYTKLPIIILTVTFIFLFIIFFYDNFINVVGGEKKPKLEHSKVVSTFLKEIGSARIGNEKLIDALLTNKDISRRFIIRHAKDTDKFLILQNRNTPRELIDKAIASVDENDRVAVSLNTSLTNDEMMKLANDSSLLVRANLATNPALPYAIMKKLSRDSLTVQDGLIENPSVTDEILQPILNGRVVDCELNRKIFSSPLTGSSELSYYKDSEDICIKEGIALNRNTPHIITELYISSDNRNIREYALQNGKLSKVITDRYFNRNGQLPTGQERNILEERLLLLRNPNLDKSIYQRVILESPYTDGVIVAKRDIIDNETLALLLQFAESYGGVDNFISECKNIANNAKAISEVINKNRNDKFAVIRYIKREVNYQFIRNIYDPYLLATLLSKYKIYSDYDNLSYINFNDIDISLEDNYKDIPVNFSDNAILIDRINLLDKSEKITFETIKLADNITYSTTVYLLPMVKKNMIDNKLGNTQNIDEFLSKASGEVISTDERLKAFISKSLKPLNNFYE